MNANDPLKPYEPSPRRPWNAAAAAQLLRRAGFAPGWAELQAAVAAGPRETVRGLVYGEAPEPAAYGELAPLGPAIAVRDDIHALRGWWLLRMARTARPLHARLAVFWHNHFATSNAKVRSARLMLQQLRTIEEHSAGRFGELVLAIARDPAMIVWLDGGLNVKGRPNENFARELFELFTLGVGHYSEHDIQEAARAFTGWRQRNGRFDFAPLDHDEGEKSVLGQSGRLTGDGVIAAAVAQPACGRFIAGKLLQEFLTPRADEALVDALAAKFRACDGDLAATLETLLGSEVFFDPAVPRARIKSPVEFAIGLARSLELNVPAGTLADATSQMGQALFEPPSVAGWEGGRTWLDTATMLVRLNTAQRAVREVLKPEALCTSAGVDDAAGARELAISLTLDEATPAAVRERIDALQGRSADVLREALQLLTACPEYQLC